MSTRIVVEVYGCDDGAPDGLCFQNEIVDCRNPRCLHCPDNGPTHGPYWYCYWKQGTRTRSVYIGRELDTDKAERLVAKLSRRRKAKS